jgi:hypothetical protein
MGSIVYRDGAVGLVAGLSWSVLSSDADRLTGAGLRKKIRRQSSLLGASRFVLNPLAGANHLGLYTAPLLSRDKAPRQMHSLALVFLMAFNRADKNSVNAILLMPIQGDDERRALVIVEGGQVVHDRIERATDAIALVQKFRNTSGLQYAVFSVGHEVHDATDIGWSQLLATANKNNALQNLPRNIALLASLTVAVVLAVVGLAYFQWVIGPAREHAAQLAKAEQENKTPAYLQKLRQGLSVAGWEVSDLTQFLEQQHQTLAYTKGWGLEKIVCDIDAQQCRYHYTRVGGEIDALIAQLPGKTYDLQTASKDAAQFNAPFVPVFHSLSRADLPKANAWPVPLNTRLQRLTDAGAKLATLKEEAWPSQGIELKKVDAAVVVRRAAVEMTLPLPLVPSALAELPPFLGWRSFVLVVNHSSDKSALLTVQLKGHRYAQ